MMIASKFAELKPAAPDSHEIAWQLDVLSDSVAVNFYKQMGMEVIAMTRVPYLEKNYGISKYYRMRKDLDE